MKKLFLKKSLLDMNLIEIKCKRFLTTKDGIIAILEDNTREFYSTSEYYFWGLEDENINITLPKDSNFYSMEAVK